MEPSHRSMLREAWVEMERTQKQINILKSTGKKPPSPRPHYPGGGEPPRCPPHWTERRIFCFRNWGIKQSSNLGGRLIFFILCRYNGAGERSFVVQNIILSFLPDILHFTHFELRLSFHLLRKCSNQQMIWRKGNSNNSPPAPPWRKIGKDFLKTPANVC